MVLGMVFHLVEGWGLSHFFLFSILIILIVVLVLLVIFGIDLIFLSLRLIPPFSDR